ncbi:questin oxidase family protein [Actinoallomurus oryzae]|uniref:Questin oxidase family protein n=1 Tax=Actinoallomurus oryzae TaxID=502180 RepID=A0ABP8PVI3_9ACTN
MSSTISYGDAVNDALDRLRGVGFEFGPGFVNHAPMVAETLATVGCRDLVATWVERNKRLRAYLDPPAGGTPLSGDDPGEWRPALGDFRRVLDWVDMFDARLSSRPWPEVLLEWWPRLLPGMYGMLTHGFIRTAHAVRSLAATDEPGPLQLRELAHGLGYWAARHTPVPAASEKSLRLLPAAREDIGLSLSALTVTTAGLYAEHVPRPSVPLVHSVTAPAALRLFLPLLPADLHRPAYDTLRQAAAAMWDTFPSGGGDAPASAPGYEPPSTERLLVDAVDFGDEHTIKLAEACKREYALLPDPRYRAAADMLLHRMKTDGL